MTVHHPANEPDSGELPEINGLRVEQSILIQHSPQALYSFWRNFENLPQIMNHLESVQVISPTRSRWTANAPAGTTVEWEAEIINDISNELIAWRSLAGATVPNEGAVRFLYFSETETEVRVSLEYEPPGGQLGVLLAKLFGEEPEQQISDDLLRFKQLMEANPGLSNPVLSA